METPKEEPGSTGRTDTNRHTCFTQVVAQGEHEPGNHALNPMTEAEVHGVLPNVTMADDGSGIPVTSINEGVQPAPPVGN